MGIIGVNPDKEGNPSMPTRKRRDRPKAVQTSVPGDAGQVEVESDFYAEFDSDFGAEFDANLTADFGADHSAEILASNGEEESP